MYRIAICDGNPIFITRMEQMIRRCFADPVDIEFFPFSSGKDLLRGMDLLPSCELLILDMELKGQDSIRIAAMFRQSYPDAVLVLCADVSAPTEDVFKVMPFRFLKKGYPDEKMLQELDEVVRKLLENHPVPYVWGKHYHSFIRLSPKDILFIENHKQGSRLHVTREIMTSFLGEGKSITTSRKLGELYEGLKDYGFEYAHNSYIVNLRYVKCFASKRVITLLDGCELNVSRSKADAFSRALEKLHQFLINPTDN